MKERQRNQKDMAAADPDIRLLVAHYVLSDVFIMPNRRLANGDTEGFAQPEIKREASRPHRCGGT